MSKLYKYLGPEMLKKVFFKDTRCALKCSYPKDFNDPFELFLTINYNQSPEVLAYYKEVIGDIPQLPTTCFSRSPEIIPMWAHYTNNHKGIVIEFDEDKIAKSIKGLEFGDIKYATGPDSSLTQSLFRALETGKPRHTYFLQVGVFSSAYFTKSMCWSYELERRLIVKEHKLRSVAKLMLLDVPNNCISAIIVGAKAITKTKRNICSIANGIGCKYYEMRLGKSSSKPYFIDGSGTSYVFNDANSIKETNTCQNCGEPVINQNELCPWCAIGDEDQYSAEMRNPMRILAHVGLLDGYYNDMEKIRRGKP